MYLEAIRKLSEKREGGLKKLATDIGMSEANLHRCIRNNKIQASDLENIAQCLNVDVKTFFEGNGMATHPTSITTGDNSIATIEGNVSIKGGAISTMSNEVISEKIKSLEQQLSDKEKLIKEKEKLIEEKERTIKILMGK